MDETVLVSGIFLLRCTSDNNVAGVYYYESEGCDGLSAPDNIQQEVIGTGRTKRERTETGSDS